MAGMMSARRLTDAQLLSAEFRRSDPENTIVGLNLGVPDPDANPTIVGYYDETPPGGRASGLPFIRCCHCGKRRHWKGHVVRDDRGETYIIGARQCGREHYGVRYDAAEKAFKAEQARRAVLIRWGSMLKLAGAFREEVTRLLASPTLSELELKRDEFKRASPVAFGKLARIVATGAPMMEIVEFRDFAAENERKARFDSALASFQALPSEERRERRDAGLRPEEETTPIYRRRSTPLGNMVGGGFLIGIGDVRGLALSLRGTLDRVDAIGDTTTDAATTTDMSRLLREVGDGSRLLNQAMVEVGSAVLFFEAGNLERICRWSRNEAQFDFKHEDARLIVDDPSRGRSRIAPLTIVDLPLCDTIRASPHFEEDFVPTGAVDGMAP